MHERRHAFTLSQRKGRVERVEEKKNTRSLLSMETMNFTGKK
jgi:hypothetical protein